MKAILTWVCCALAGGAFAQQPPSLEAPPPAASEAALGGQAEHPAAPDKEVLQVRVRHLLDDFDQRHQQRVLEMASYDKVGDDEPSVKRLANPRKVKVEIKDELDREQTSQALAKEYAQEAVLVQNQEQSLQDFIAKRQKTLDDLTKRAGAVNRQDLELAAANLARQPGTETQVREIRRQLADADRAQQELAVEQPQTQQEASSAEEELKKLHTLEQSLLKESKAYKADAASAHQNQLNLADRLEFYLVDAQAEDVIDQDIKAAEAAPHLAASREVQDTLESLAPRTKEDAKPDEKCAATSTDSKGCLQTPAPGPKE